MKIRSARISDAGAICDLINAHADEVTAIEESEAQQKNRQTLFENVTEKT